MQQVADAQQVLKSITGICDDVSIEHRIDILAQLERFTRRTKAELLSSRAEASEGEQNSEDYQISDIANNEHGSQALPFANWGTIVHLRTVNGPLSKELTVERLNNIMRLFRDQLVGLGKVQTVHETSVVTYQWTLASATELANHISSTMFGGMADGLRCDIDPLERSRKSSNQELDEWAKEAAENTPPLIASLFHHVANVRKHRSYHDSHFCLLAKHWHQYKLTKVYDELRSLLDEQDEQLVNYLSTRIDIWPEDVFNAATVDIFLEEEWQFAGWKAVNRPQICRQGSALVSIVEVFGEGALGFLSDYSSKW